jgi:hypothetical protein
MYAGHDRHTEQLKKVRKGAYHNQCTLPMQGIKYLQKKRRGALLKNKTGKSQAK